MCACVHMYVTCLWVPKEHQRDYYSHGTKVIKDCEPSDLCFKNRTLMLFRTKYS